VKDRTEDYQSLERDCHLWAGWAMLWGDEQQQQQWTEKAERYRQLATEAHWEHEMACVIKVRVILNDQVATGVHGVELSTSVLGKCGAERMVVETTHGDSE
jgi:hypothetical protein